MLSSPFPLSALPTGPMPSGITGGRIAEEKPQKPLDISPTLWYNTRMKDIEIMGDALEEIALIETLDAWFDNELTEADIDAWHDMLTQQENA